MEVWVEGLQVLGIGFLELVCSQWPRELVWLGVTDATFASLMNLLIQLMKEWSGGEGDSKCTLGNVLAVVLGCIGCGGLSTSLGCGNTMLGGDDTLGSAARIGHVLIGGLIETRCGPNWSNGGTTLGSDVACGDSIMLGGSPGDRGVAAVVCGSSLWKVPASAMRW